MVDHKDRLNDQKRSKLMALDTMQFLTESTRNGVLTLRCLVLTATTTMHILCERAIWRRNFSLNLCNLRQQRSKLFSYGKHKKLLIDKQHYEIGPGTALSGFI